MKLKNVLVVDDDQAILNFMRIFLLQAGEYRVQVLQDSTRAYHMLQEQKFDILLLDMDMPEVTGMDILRFIARKQIDVVTIVLTGVEDIDMAISAMKLGTADYMLKPIHEEQLLKTLRTAISKNEITHSGTDSGGSDEDLLEQLPHRKEFSHIITGDQHMHKIFHLAEKFAETDNSVLIWGESGTGKELIARSIHRISRRKDKKFVAVNAGAFANDLFASEFFGHDKGSFTGAVTDKKGFIEEAQEGTLFLDEIGELSLPIQVKLLRVLQEEEFYRLGSTKHRKADVRIIAATNKNLFEEIKKGNFRKDLFFRLNINSLQLPPLRKRTGDIELLARHFLEQFNQKYQKNITGIAPVVLRQLKSYPFPGNVRELMNIINSAIIIEPGRELHKNSLPHYFLENAHPGGNEDTGCHPLQTLEEVEKDYIRQVLAYTDNNNTHSARILGISRVSLISKIKKYQLK